MNIKVSSILLTVFFLASCSSDISSSKLAEIEKRTDEVELLFDKYEDLNDDLMDIIEDQDYAFKMFTKVKKELREVDSSVTSRKKRIASMENPEAKEGETATPAPEEVIAPHREKLAELEEEKAELQAEADGYLAETREYTAQALKLRKERNAVYNKYTKSRQALKKLKE